MENIPYVVVPFAFCLSSALHSESHFRIRVIHYPFAAFGPAVDFASLYSRLHRRRH